MITEDERSKLWLYTCMYNAHNTASALISEAINLQIDRLLTLEERANEYIQFAMSDLARAETLPEGGGLELTFLVIPGFTVLTMFKVQVEWEGGFT